MRFLFIVQGEGRGHITQALSLSAILQHNGHQVSEVLIGNSEMRRIPQFFFEQVNAPVQCYKSPNFLKTVDNKHFEIFKSIRYNLGTKYRTAYFDSIRLIHNRIEELKPDYVVNFYELLCGLAYRHYKIDVPMISIAHQFIFEHSGYVFGHKLNTTQRLLRLYTKLCSLNAHKRLALSFTPMPHDTENGIYVIPPLLRREVLDMQPVVDTVDPYILGYILNHGFAGEITRWHEQNREVQVHVFWDNPDVPKSYSPHDRLTYHQLDDRLFLEMLKGCTAFFGTAGFESVCEALYLDKPIMIVPAHAEQEMNVADARQAGINLVSSKSFDLDRLMEIIPGFGRRTGTFRDWTGQLQWMISDILDIR